jgi:4-aminobutyrate aminotransferase / (S)-3-amino-2-methylpropionate transaminase / 5-aminovalerate transaminase
MLSDDEILELDARYCSFGDTVHYMENPKVFRKCEGSFMFDSEGKPYLDLQMWYSACNFGYGNKRINDAVKEQVDTLPQIASQVLHESKALLASKLCEANRQRFGINGRVHFNVGGSQAIEDALKLIRNYTGKNLMFAFMGGYHGRTLGASSITSSYRYRRRFGHFSERAHFVPFPYRFRCQHCKGLSECNFSCIKHFESLFESEYNSFYDTKAAEAEFSAFFIEPVQSTGGYVIPPKGYFKRLKEILDRYNILLVDDEIQMGFYRTGKLWAIEHFDIKPDVIVFGKSLTNGMNPLSGLFAREELIDPKVFPPGSTHSTFSSNPLGMRAGVEVMNIIEEANYEDLVMNKGKRFLDGLGLLKKRYKEIGDVDGLGLALRIEICEDDGFTPSRALTDRVVQEGLRGSLDYGSKKYGLVLDIGGYHKNVLTLAPSLHITDEEINMAIELLDESFRRCIQ